MKQIYFTKVEDKKVIDSVKTEWKERFSAPIDDYYDYMINSGDHWSIKEGNQIIGYASIDNKNGLRQFFLSPLYLENGVAIFKQMIESHEIKEAHIATSNPICLSIAMHFQKSIEIEAYLFTSLLEGNLLEKEGAFRVAEPADLDTLVEFCHQTIEAPKDWLKEYIAKWIKRQEYFIFENEQEIIGICEVRTSDEKSNVACLGMVVSKNHRKKGVGTFLLGKAKEIALNRNHEPICSCDKDNMGSLKAIQANGFRAIHQMLKITFQ